MLVFYFMEWTKVLYNGLETNIEVTKCGRVKKVQKEWYGNHSSKYGEIDVLKLKPTNNGYLRINVQIKGLKPKSLLFHSILASAFLGYKWNGQKNVVDHINRNRLDNSLQNLQVISQRENINKDILKYKKSNLPLGVCFRKSSNRYFSTIQIDKKYINLGTFDTPEEASNAYKTKLKEIENK